METDLQGIELGRDTTECCDPKNWFPMGVTYQREMKVKTELDRLGIENFVPMRYKVVESRNEGDTELRRELVPAISNLIFVRSTQERVSELKQSNEVLEPLRYMMDRTASREHAIMTVADRDMENFMRVASMTDKIGWTDEMIEKQSRIIDVLRKPQKCPVCGERVVDIIYGTGDMTEIEFVMEYRKELMVLSEQYKRINQYQ